MSVTDFPEGEGPPRFLYCHRGEWARLGQGLGRLVTFSREEGGAFAFGLATGRAIIWAYAPPTGPGAAYCYHAAPGPLDPAVEAKAFAAIGCAPSDFGHLFVVIASSREVSEAEELASLTTGVPRHNLCVYSQCFVPQFGVSAAGLVCEAR